MPITPSFGSPLVFRVNCDFCHKFVSTDDALLVHNENEGTDHTMCPKCYNKYAAA